MPLDLLNSSLNVIPTTVRHIHLMGICGTGMAALGGMLKTAGYDVTGSDEHVYPPMSEFLAQAGISVQPGYAADNLTHHPDLVIVGNVITSANPEAKALAELAIPYISFPQAVNHYFLAGKTSLVVVGTHGKTTTSSILSFTMHKAGLAPGFMIGGLVQDFGRNFNIGTGKYFVVEGDEYDTAFFDKGPKFLHYRPEMVIITSIEFDHADIYADLAAVKKSFQRLVGILPANGAIVAHLDDPVVREVVAAAPCPVYGYGMNPDLSWSLTDLAVADAAGPLTTSFAVYHDGKLFGKFMNAMPGRHNALNALAVIALLNLLGMDKRVIANGLANFKGVKRRQEVRGEVNGITVIDDFAHHPTAVRETLIALHAAYGERRLLAVFEPRTNSSRRKVFQFPYVAAFDHAAQVLIKEPTALANVPVEERFSARRLVTDLQQRGVAAHFFAATEEIIGYLAQTARAGDVIAVFSNGGFDNIHERLLEKLREN